jgi:hypothetical protein
MSGGFAASLTGRPMASIALDRTHETEVNRKFKATVKRPTPERMEKDAKLMTYRAAINDSFSAHVRPSSEHESSETGSILDSSYLKWPERQRVLTLFLRFEANVFGETIDNNFENLGNCFTKELASGKTRADILGWKKHGLEGYGYLIRNMQLTRMDAFMAALVKSQRFRILLVMKKAVLKRSRNKVRKDPKLSLAQMKNQVYARLIREAQRCLSSDRAAVVEKMAANIKIEQVENFPRAFFLANGLPKIPTDKASYKTAMLLLNMDGFVSSKKVEILNPVVAPHSFCSHQIPNRFVASLPDAATDGTCLVVDGFVFLYQCFPPASVTTVADWLVFGAKKLSRLFFNSGYSEISLVFDRSDIVSKLGIKQFTQSQRDVRHVEVFPVSVSFSDPFTNIAELMSRSKKQSSRHIFCRFLRDSFQPPHATQRLYIGGHELGGTDSVNNSHALALWNGNWAWDSRFENHHGEADFSMFRFVAVTPCRCVIISSVDTDVWVWALFLCVTNTLVARKKLFIQLKSDITLDLAKAVESLCKSVLDIHTLVALYCLTGCDYTPHFYGFSKSSWVLCLKENEDFIFQNQKLLYRGQTSWVIDECCYLRMVVSCYVTRNRSTFGNVVLSEMLSRYNDDIKELHQEVRQQLLVQFAGNEARVMPPLGSLHYHRMRAASIINLVACAPLKTRGNLSSRKQMVGLFQLTTVWLCVFLMMMII